MIEYANTYAVSALAKRLLLQRTLVTSFYKEYELHIHLKDDMIDKHLFIHIFSSLV